MVQMEADSLSDTTGSISTESPISGQNYEFTSSDVSSPTSDQDEPATAQDFMADMESLLNAQLQLFNRQLYAMDRSCEKASTNLVRLEDSLVTITKTSQPLLEESNKLLHSPIANELKAYRCPICMTAFKKVIFQCGHAFCSDCAGKTDKQEAEVLCPLCRKKVVERTTVIMFGE